VTAPTTVRVQAPRAIRGAWVTSVYNIMWPSKSGLTPAAAEAELVALLDSLKSAGANAVFLQVRPESDALYKSDLEPWSQFLTGRQGQDPGYDPLSVAIARAHERNLELHAWINPFRGMTSAATATEPNHPTRRFPNSTVTWGSQKWLDPGARDVQSHVVAVVRDIVKRYRVDGIHFDDYFYPYPIEGRTFPDDASFGAYQRAGGTLARDDYRRDNLHTFVRAVSEAIKQERPDVRFGVSPFGIWKNGVPAGIRGLDAYSSLYCDSPRWLQEGWVDYLAPQLYWPTTRAAQDFKVLMNFWAGFAKDGRDVVIGHDVTKIGSTEYPASEYTKQFDLVTGARDQGVAGSILFSSTQIPKDQDGLRSKVLAEAWQGLAATPVKWDAPKTDLAPLQVKVVTGDGKAAAAAAPAFVVSLPEGQDTARARAMLLYVEEKDGLKLQQQLPASELPRSIHPHAMRPETSGRIVVSWLDTFGRESPGVVLASY
jgi:uncharacterized lipoprotein YddW (UPF0748 family)